MKILSINGSPNPRGNSQNIVNAILKEVSDEHKIEKLNLYELNYKDCIACKDANSIHLEKNCIHDDDFTNILLPKIIAADLIILCSPVYIGQVTGKFKTMLDRWYTFVMKDFKIRSIKNKKFITVVTSGAPSDTFRYVSEYLEKWLGNFLKMQKIAVIHAGGYQGESGECDKPEVLEKAREIGKKL